jgi:catechol 2,3-dioxygenase-like lactoylglutathione lyase family enzyme
MLLPKSHIHLDSDDLPRSITFYQALLGAPPSRQSASFAVFDLDSPAVVLTLEQRAPRRRSETLATLDRNPTRMRDGERLPSRESPQYALVVSEPQQVGDAAIALRRAGVPLRLQDAGIEVKDPDGNAWRVRFVPSAKGRTVVATREDRAR